MNDLADENLAATVSFLGVHELSQTSQTCSNLNSVVRSDRLWLPLFRQRWRFGSLPANTQELSPGDREVAAVSAITQALHEPLRTSADAFAFYVKRCKADIEAAILILQAHTAQPSACTSESDREFSPGVVVQINGLTTAQHHNGRMGVVSSTPYAGPERYPVLLAPSAEPISVRGRNLTFVRPAITAAIAEQQLFESGAECIDALLQMSTLSKGAISAIATKLLLQVMDRWAMRQWDQLKADKQRLDLLEEGGLVVAQWADPKGADVSSVRATLASFAEEAAQKAPPDAPLRERIDAVNSVLFDKHGFSGNAEDYYDPRNSLLHVVLSRKKGIPISLSVLWAAVARRLEVPCHLCARMPQHILIRVSTGIGRRACDDLYVDAFNCKVMDYSSLLCFVRERGMGASVQEGWVAEHPATAVYARMLMNLSQIYKQRSSNHRASLDMAPAWHNLLRSASACAQIASISDDQALAEHMRRESSQLRRLVDNLEVSGTPHMP